MKKLIKIFLSCLLMLNLVQIEKIHATEVCGTNGEVTIVYLDEAYPNAGIEIINDDSDSDLLFEIESRIKAALTSGVAEVNVSDLGVKASERDIVKKVYTIPYLSNGISVKLYAYSTGEIAKYVISNPMTVEETVEYMNRVDYAISVLLQKVTTDMSSVEKLLVLHDYLAMQYAYDYDDYVNQTLTDAAYRAGDLLMNHTGVCEAYSTLYMYLLFKLGYEVYYVAGDYNSAGNTTHAWNIVKVDGKYYHVDVTWDDPVYDQLGYAYHNHFLLSDGAMANPRGNSSKGHNGWERTDLVCSDTTYDNYWWYGVNSSIVIDGDYYYYLQDRALMKRHRTMGVVTTLEELGLWSATGNAYYTGTYSGLFKSGEYLFYNTAKSIYKYHLGTGVVESVMTLSDAERSFYGIQNQNGALYYALATSPSEKQAVYSYSGVVLEKDVLHAKSIYFTDDELMVPLNETKQLSYSYLPTNAEVSVSFTSSDSTVATVDANGLLTAKGLGKTTITLHTTNGLKDTCEVYTSVSGSVGENVIWTLYGNGKLELTGSGDMTNYTSSMNVPWYKYRNTITNIDIQEGITSIGDYIFCGLTTVSTIHIPEGVTYIGDSAFRASGFTSVSLPNSLETIGKNAFYNSEIASIVIPNKVKELPYQLFTYCDALETVTLPNTLESIGDYVFENCPSLKAIALPNTVTSLGRNVFMKCSELEKVTLSNQLTKIPMSTFSDCTSLKNIEIFSGVTSIGDNAFDGCTSLESVIIPSTVTTIRPGAFQYCAALKSITLPSGLTSLGVFALNGCSSLQTITIPSGVGILAQGVLYKCSGLTEVYIPEGITTIENQALCTNGETMLYLPDSITTIGTTLAIGQDCTMVINDNRTLYNYARNNNIKYICHALRLTLNKTEVSLDAGQSETLTVTAYPNYANTELAWTSSDTSIASVDQNGKVSGIKSGKATISVSNAKGTMGSCTVTVYGPIEEVQLNTSSLQLEVNQSETLTVSYRPEFTNTDTTMSWSSSNEDIARVDQTGNVLAIRAGEATITVTSSNGKTASCTVKVVDILPKSIVLNKTALTLYDKGPSEQLLVQILPENATDKAVTWSSSVPTVATVDENGVVTSANKVLGTTVITAKTSNGLEASCTVTVISPIESISFEANTYVYDMQDENGAIVVKPTFETINEYYNDTLVWKSIDSSIATIDATTGVITLCKPGSVTITATTVNNKSASFTLKITKRMTGVIIENPIAEMYENDEYQFIAKVVPDDTTDDKTLTWSVSGVSGTLSQDGCFKPVSLSSNAKIRVTAKNGMYAEISFKVVEKPIASIEMEKLPIKLEYVMGEAFNINYATIKVNYEDGTHAIKVIDAYQIEGYNANVTGEQTITVNYKGFTTTFTVNVVPRAPKSMEISKYPIERVYLEGEELDIHDGVLAVTYNDKSVNYISFSEAEISGYDKNKVGVQTVTIAVSRLNMSVEMDVTVRAKSATSISVVADPTNMIWVQGAPLDLTGGILQIAYDNGTYDHVDLAAAEVSGYQPEVNGTQTLTVTYNGLTCEWRIFLLRKEAVRLDITQLPSKLVYYPNEEVDLRDGKMLVEYNNGLSETLSLDKATIEDFNMTVGTHEVTISYMGMNDTFTVTVIDYPKVTGIEITKLPNKTEYYVNEDLDMSGLVVKATMSDDTTYNVDVKDITVEGYDEQKVGKQVVTIVYQGYKDTYEVVVKERVYKVDAIQIASNPIKTQYMVGESLDITGLKVVANYENHTQKEVVDYVVSGYDANKVGQQTITVTYDGKTTSFVVEVIAKQEEVKLEDVYRIFGNNRYETAFKVANTLKQTLGVDKFDAVIVANGTNFADALAGSYLSAKKNAPILMTDKKAANITNLVNYIQANLRDGGTVYILGGTAALPNTIDAQLYSNYYVKRLAGSDRYATNLLILDEAGITNEDLLVCTGTNFADSLSASAAGRPMLLVGKKVTQQQKDFLYTLNPNNKIYIIGGTGAVNSEIETEMYKISVDSPIRLAGANRYQTSVMVAEEFFEAPTSAVLALATNFPDGLSGGALAYAIKSPLLLTNAQIGNYAVTGSYTNSRNIHSGYVLGGPGLVTDAACKFIFAMQMDSTIVSK